MAESRFVKLDEPVPAAERANDPLEERTLSTSILLDGKFIQVCRDEVSLPDGRDSFRVYLTHPGAAGIVALYEDGSILLERQCIPCGRAFGKFLPGSSTLRNANLTAPSASLKRNAAFERKPGRALA